MKLFSSFSKTVEPAGATQKAGVDKSPKRLRRWAAYSGIVAGAMTSAMLISGTAQASTTNWAEWRNYGTATTNATTTCSGDPSDGPGAAIDGVYSMSWFTWCTPYTRPTLTVNLSSVKQIRKIVIRHAGVAESDSNTTRSYELFVRVNYNNQLVKVADVTNNTQDVTTYIISSGNGLSTNQMYLAIREPTQTSFGGGGTTRIYEFEAYDSV